MDEFLTSQTGEFLIALWVTIAFVTGMVYIIMSVFSEPKVFGSNYLPAGAITPLAIVLIVVPPPISIVIVGGWMTCSLFVNLYRGGQQ